MYGVCMCAAVNFAPTKRTTLFNIYTLTNFITIVAARRAAQNITYISTIEDQPIVYYLLLSYFVFVYCSRCYYYYYY